MFNKIKAIKEKGKDKFRKFEEYLKKKTTKVVKKIRANIYNSAFMVFLILQYKELKYKHSLELIKVEVEAIKINKPSLYYLLSIISWLLNFIEKNNLINKWLIIMGFFWRIWQRIKQLLKLLKGWLIKNKELIYKLLIHLLRIKKVANKVK